MTWVIPRPYISVVTPSLNQGRYLHDAIASVANQNYDNCEHIVVDALSTDETLDVLKAHEDSASLRWLSEADRGQSDALNKGVRLARGEWVLWLNADDLLLDGALDAFAEAIERHPHADVFYGHQRFVDEQGQGMKTVFHLPFRYRLVRHARYLPPSTGSVFRRALLLEEPLREDLHFLMDKEWWWRCGASLQAVRVNTVVSAFRVTDSSKTGASVMGAGASPAQRLEADWLEQTYDTAGTRYSALTAIQKWLRFRVLRLEYLLHKSRYGFAYGANTIRQFGGEARQAQANYGKDLGLVITYVGSFSGQGGAERSVQAMAKLQSLRGHSIHLHALKSPASREFFKDFPGEVVIRGEGAVGAVMSLVRLRRAIATSDVVISVSEFTPTFIGWLLAWLMRTPHLAEVRTHLSALRMTPIQKWVARLVYPRIALVRTVSHGVADDLIDGFAVERSRVRVVLNGFDLHLVRDRGRGPIQPQHGTLFDSRVVVCVGRLTAQKRFDLAIDAFAEALHLLDADARLIIVGEGDLRRSLEQHAARQGVGDRVHLIGYVGNPYPYIRQADALLLSSDYEGFGRVIIEAMALGCPVVATDCPSGPSEIIEDRVSGILVPVGSSSAMATALARILSESDTADQLADAGMRRASDFTIDRTVEQYDALLRSFVVYNRRKRYRERE